MDASALLAVLLREADADEFYRVLAGTSELAVSAVGHVEVGIRIDRNDAIRDEYDNLRAVFRIDIRPVTSNQAEVARVAYARYGKGRHSARLNLGDCFAYALSKETGRSLLFKGNDFALTDIRSAR